MRYSPPGTWSGRAQRHLTAVRVPTNWVHNMFDLTRNQTDHTCRKRTCLLPSVAHVMCHRKNWSCRENEVSDDFDRVHSDRQAIWRGTLGHPEQRDMVKKVHNHKAHWCALPRRITNSKLSILKSGPSSFTLNRVASNGSMAPCRSHHGNHTRQERIIIVIRQELSPETCKPA